MSAITLAEHKLLPDSLVRFGIKKLLKQRLQDEYANDPEQQNQHYQQLLENLRQSPIAIEKPVPPMPSITKSQRHFISLPWENI